MMDNNEFIEIEKILLEKIRFAVVESIEPSLLEDLKITKQLSFLANIIAIKLKGFVYGVNIAKKENTYYSHEIKYPTNWWEAFREKWFPEFWKRKFPIIYNEPSTKITIYQDFKNICPHLPNTGLDKHIYFLKDNKDWINKIDKEDNEIS